MQLIQSQYACVEEKTNKQTNKKAQQNKNKTKPKPKSNPPQPKPTLKQKQSKTKTNTKYYITQTFLTLVEIERWKYNPSNQATDSFCLNIMPAELSIQSFILYKHD